MIEKKEIMNLQGIIDICKERKELFLTDFQEENGFENEECHDLHDVLHCFDKKKVKITIEHICD